MYSYFEHRNIVKHLNTTRFKITGNDLGKLGKEGLFKRCLEQRKCVLNTKRACLLVLRGACVKCTRFTNSESDASFQSEGRDRVLVVLVKCQRPGTVQSCGKNLSVGSGELRFNRVISGI